jgi:hypothetical protein
MRRFVALVAVSITAAALPVAAQTAGAPAESRQAAAPAAAAAGTNMTLLRQGADRVTLRTTAQPLGHVLEALTALEPLDMKFMDEQVRSVRVTVAMDNVTVDQAVRRLLAEAGVDFAVGGIKGEPLQVVVGKLGSARPSERQLASADKQPAENPDAEPPQVDTPGASDKLEVTNPEKGPAYSMVGESVTYTDPNFVPYKNTEQAKRARMSVDVTKIP